MKRHGQCFGTGQNLYKISITESTSSTREDVVSVPKQM